MGLMPRLSFFSPLSSTVPIIVFSAKGRPTNIEQLAENG